MAEAEATPVAELSFEEALKELESVVHRLESGQALARGLDRALRPRRRAAPALRRQADGRRAPRRADRPGPRRRVSHPPARPRLSDGRGAAAVPRAPEPARDAPPRRRSRRCCPPEDAPLGAAMRYAVLSGGKRLRAFLAVETAALFNAPAGPGAARGGGGRVRARLQPRARRPALHGRRRPAPRPADRARQVGRGHGRAGRRRAADPRLRDCSPRPRAASTRASRSG